MAVAVARRRRGGAVAAVANDELAAAAFGASGAKRGKPSTPRGAHT